MKISPLKCILSVAALTAAFSAQAATLSVLGLDNGLLDEPEGLVFNTLITGTNPTAGGERDIKEGRNNAQTFTLDVDTVIDKIVINFESAAFNNDNTATFEFFSVGNPTADKLDIDQVFDSMVFSSNQLGMAHGTLIFDVANTVATAGSSFGIRFTTASDEPILFKWKFTTTPGQPFRYEKDNYVKNDSIGYYTIGVVAVPEPSTYALMAGVGVLAFAILRKRRT